MPETTAGRPGPFAPPAAEGASPSPPPGLAEAVERERLRLAQELHDTLAQELSGISLIARTLEKKLRGGPGGAEVALAAEIARGTQAAADRVRDMARGLAPAPITAGELAPALASLAALTERRYGVACVFECDDARVVCDDATEHQVFRIAQEAIANAVRHAQARHITVSLGARPGGFALRVRDDGAGICDEDRGKGLGLGIMRDRAALIDGALAVEAAEGGGTVVTCTFSPAPPSDTRGGAALLHF
jgi:signal transduction histidine kinase